MVRSIIHLIPGAPPFVNGVGDFALTVARELRRNWAIDSNFLVCSPCWEGPAVLDRFKLTPMRSRTSDGLCTALRSTAVSYPAVVLLQLSPYGFDKNGSPFWLLSGLKHWKEEDPANHKVFTYFHELFATSMPWRRAFWVSPLQRVCSRGIARLSDVALTSMERHVELLEKWDPAKKGLIPSLPVVSNVGEPAEVLALHQRLRRLVIWGSTAAKRKIYERQYKTVEAAIHAIGVGQILDVGQAWHGCPTQLAGVPVRIMGILPPEQLSNVLANSVLGIFSYNPNCLGKSGIFAAFCAHGVPAVCLPTNSVEERTWDNICQGVHYVTSAHAARENSMEMLGQIAKMAREWYSGHRISEHARVLAGSILNCTKV